MRKALKVNSALELNDAAVCVQQGTTTELNLADFFRANNMKLKTVTFATSDEAVKAYDAGRCDAYTTDASGALCASGCAPPTPTTTSCCRRSSRRSRSDPSVRHGDDQWFDIVRWVHFAMLNAEELGVTKANVDAQMKSDNPEIRRLLGTEGKYGEAFGLTNDFGVRIDQACRQLRRDFRDAISGRARRLKISRGLNALWTKGGLQYAPPVR